MREERKIQKEKGNRGGDSSAEQGHWVARHERGAMILEAAVWAGLIMRI